ncbi:dipeptidase [Emticicia sp. 21SJ11W-3]|uniref:dipeptidase n=1 Tax=Emticicia sp. 21SJ11W-3 TaxID=2916755 RepID=UPI0020A05833|nr:membrane dipeptidase [Emticicia sp. 21SJ11W-3]UTA69103.1 membrane dipeptidase [Emticicia sp. 21SJ11W-3]
MIIIDAHLDIAMNAIEWNRDYRRTVGEIRMMEQTMTDKIDRGKGVVSLPELRKGKIAIIVATQLARFSENNGSMPGSGWNSPHQAWAMTQAQLAWYQAMVEAGEMVQITTSAQLDNHIALWENPAIDDFTKPVGFILSLEGADSLVNLSYLEKAYSYGLRAIGPAHYGPGRYAPGTGMTGGLTKAGRELVKEMDKLGMVLDATHLTDEGFDEALDLFQGQVWASHHNCRTLVPHQRQLNDEQIKRLVERDAVIGGCLDVWMLKPNLIQRQINPREVGANLEVLIDHFDHICQITGNSLHIAIGSDLDGTFGTEQSPYDLDTIADLQHYKHLLAKRGYQQSDIENVFHKNWLRLMRKTLA